jgi:hypothetical protein
MKVRNLLRDWKVNIVCLQETKLNTVSRRIVRCLWDCNLVDWCCLDSSEASGGILIMWDKRVVEKVVECVGDYTLVVSFRNVDDDSSWAFAGVYGPNSYRDRKLL